VIPEGNSVRVEMKYEAKYDVPAEAKAAVITPTLVADRFVQLTPAYTEGAVMETGADIPLPDTGVPVELDRIYAGLRDLTVALGPNGVNKNGTLNNTLEFIREQDARAREERILLHRPRPAEVAPAQAPRPADAPQKADGQTQTG